MRHVRLALAALTLAVPLAAQSIDKLSTVTQRFVSVPEPTVALTNVTVFDGTGAAPVAGQTVLIDRGRITAIGPTASVRVPAGARIMDLTGHTVIPGIIGVHNLRFYTAAGGR